MFLRVRNNVCENTIKLIEEIGRIDFMVNLLLVFKTPN